MSRRRHEQSDAGSDSFLDVLANLVGILVVLVVMTALQAAVGPAISEAPEAPVDVAVDVAAEEPIVAPPEPPEPVVAKVPLIAPKPNVVFEREPAPAIPAGLREEVAAAEAALAANKRRLTTMTAAAEAAGRAADAERDRAASAAEVVQRLQTVLRQAEPLAESAARAAESARLDRDLWAAKAAAAEDKPLERLEHSALPVGRRVTGKELHFRLVGDPNDPKGGLVRPVPIEALTAQLERDIPRHRRRLIDRGGYDGTVGPVSGYLMNYRIEQEPASMMGGVRGGGTRMIRFRLAGWTLKEDGDDPSASVAAALAEGSDFRFLLATAGPGATATLWVAPEAFGAFRMLRAAAREAGLSVAARPLPAGVPISGSPDGTRSVAQ